MKKLKSAVAIVLAIAINVPSIVNAKITLKADGIGGYPPIIPALNIQGCGHQRV